MNISRNSAETPQILHYLYKVYDNLGCLLYVGITDSPSRRFRYHNKYALWRMYYVYAEIKGYPDRTAAAYDEVQSILFERPLYNRNVNGRPWSYKYGMTFGPSNNSKLKNPRDFDTIRNT